MGRLGLIFSLTLASAVWTDSARAEPRLETSAPWTDSDLQGFFDTLQDARTMEEARRIEADILRIIARSGSPTVDLLLDRAQAAAQSGDLSTARELLNQCLALAPDFAEAWRRRGEIAAQRQEYAEAIGDLSSAVKLQPKHFLALESLGKLYEDSRDRDAAIGYYQSALELDPWLENARAGLKRLFVPQSQIGAATGVKSGAKAAESESVAKGGV